MKSTLKVVLSAYFYVFTEASRCFFPRPWHGEYFHLGFNAPLRVVNNTISEKGSCIENFGSHFVMEDTEYGEKCWRCMTIYRKHQNVLSYKESYCETYFDTFESLCENIAGDSQMHTMFRRDSEPVKCPFKGPFTFSYSKGGSGLNTCSFPLSYLDSCTKNHKLQLNFQACIDVQGSESISEELQCIATWAEGSKKYLVAEMNREHVYSDESKYRCFVYEKSGKGDNKTVKMAQSLSASCDGLWSPTEGYRTFDMAKVSGPQSRCELPSWVTDHHSWASLDSSIQLHVNGGEKSFKLKNLQDVLHPEDSHVSCHDIVKQEKNIVKFVTYVKSGCDSGFVCSLFSREAQHVMKVQFGHKARIPSEACSDLYFSRSVIKSLLLVSKSTSEEPLSCPLSGRYQISPGSPGMPLISPMTECFSPSLHFVSGCGSSSLTVEQQCSSHNTTKTEYSCIAHWSSVSQNSVRRTHVILSSGHNSQLLCLSYTESHGFLSTHSCHPEFHHHPFNISQAGPCVQALSSVSHACNPSSSGGTFTLLLLSFLSVSLLSSPDVRSS